MNVDGCLLIMLSKARRHEYRVVDQLCCLSVCQCVLRPPSDDHQSDTSGETTTSDSGRGGSEDDIPLPPIVECSPELYSEYCVCVGASAEGCIIVSNW